LFLYLLDIRQAEDVGNGEADGEAESSGAIVARNGIPGKIEPWSWLGYERPLFNTKTETI
jgi:hypothetical protein